jgi:hypothetical protein
VKRLEMSVGVEGWIAELAVVERDNRIGIVMKVPHPRYVGDATGCKIYAFAIVLAISCSGARAHRARRASGGRC